RGNARYHLRVCVLGAKGRHATAADFSVGCKRRTWTIHIQGWCGDRGAGSLPSLLHRDRNVLHVLHLRATPAFSHRATSNVRRCTLPRTLPCKELHSRTALNGPARWLERSTVGRP